MGEERMLSLFRLFSNSFQLSKFPFTFRVIWKTKAPLKVRSFMWEGIWGGRPKYNEQNSEKKHSDYSVTFGMCMLYA